MIVSRRHVLAGAAALPLAGQAAAFRWEDHGATVLLFDPALAEGQAFAASGREAGRQVMPLEGDRIRLASALFARRPLAVRGVSRRSDAVLVADVAAEHGYRLAAERIEGPVSDWTLAPRA